VAHRVQHRILARLLRDMRALQPPRAAGPAAAAVWRMWTAEVRRSAKRAATVAPAVLRGLPPPEGNDSDDHRRGRYHRAVRRVPEWAHAQTQTARRHAHVVRSSQQQQQQQQHQPNTAQLAIQLERLRL
jgi:hypothetical protein